MTNLTHRTVTALDDRLAQLDIRVTDYEGQTLWLASDHGGAYGCAEYATIETALDYAEDISDDVASAYRAFHDAITFRDETEPMNRDED